MKKIIVSLLIMLAFSYVIKAQSANKPIVIITQDGEVDDRSSFIRFLLYTCDFDLRGIVATNSKWQRNGHGLDWVFKEIDLYGEVRDNLLLHNTDYPTDEYLKSITVLGIENPEYLKGGAPYVDTKGSKLIENVLLEDNDELVHICVWGGVNTVAQSLWSLKQNEPEERFKRAVSRARIYCIDFQDEAGDWVVNNIPEAFIIKCYSFDLTWNYHKVKPLAHNPFPEFMSEKWLNENIKTNHGPLGAEYPQKNISEGDSPSFLNLVNNGLKAYENYSYGGWGGRFVPEKGNYWVDAYDDNNERKALWRWCDATQNDFAARMDWCVKSYDEANHAPVIDSVLYIDEANPGDTIHLKASAHDPDNDRVYFWWWHYKDVTGMESTFKIVNETADEAFFIVPEDQQKDIHIILEAKDDGIPSLKRYQRIVIQVGK